MRRLFPAPLLSASLLALWLVLNSALGLGQWLLGLALALVVPLATASLRPTPARIRNPWLIARLIMRVGRDVVLSNIAVARGISRMHQRQPEGSFVRVPLDLRDPHGIAALAAIMCVTPGTVWSELSLDRGALLLHVFDLKDEAAFIAHVKSSYEKPLMEVFE